MRCLTWNLLIQQKGLKVEQQVLLTQESNVPQECAQRPQLFVSPVVSVQDPPQHVWPPHPMPQPPQLFGSLDKATQAFPQPEKPVLHCT